MAKKETARERRARKWQEFLASSCPACGASGVVGGPALVATGEFLAFMDAPPCPACDGTGDAPASPTAAEPCATCLGCGKVANTEGMEPWTEWTSLPLHSAAAVLAGIVKPVACPTCHGKSLASARDGAPRGGES